MNWLRGIKGLILYLMAGYFFDRRNLVKARKWMGRLNANDSTLDAYMVATDAMLYLLEGRTSGAARRFSDCLELIERPQFPNHEYLKIFCEFWLITFSDDAMPKELEAMADQAAGLPVDKWLRSRFRFPPKKSIHENVRRANSDCVAVAFDF